MSVFLLFLALRRKAETARDVLGRMQKGDLKARFKVSIWDEAGQFALLFNRMADEIERLVERLKENDKVRVHLLQELAHDLRTPVSSLRNLIESLNFNRDTLDKESQNQLTELAFQETEYLTRLVEDLLFLALVMEPKYNSKSEETDFDDIVETQLAAVSAKYPNLRSEVQISGSPLKVSGDRHMLSRLVRNALENAFSYARSMVQIRIERDGRKIHLFIRDDGPGFSPDALASFGSKRATRYQDGHSGGRLSVGLGSVIMQVIAQAHGGCVKVANREESGAVRGAELKISVDAIAGRGLPA
jgi:K+-sensing histidine kinase KdpD